MGTQRLEERPRRRERVRRRCLRIKQVMEKTQTHQLMRSFPRNKKVKEKTLAHQLRRNFPRKKMKEKTPLLRSNFPRSFLKSFLRSFLSRSILRKFLRRRLRQVGEESGEGEDGCRNCRLCNNERKCIINKYLDTSKKK